jgi:hypothetical protein
MYIGLGMLGLCVIFSLIYLLQKMTTDNQKLSQDLKFQRSATEELHSLLIQYVEEHKPYVEYIKVREPLQKEFREREKKIIGEEQKKSDRKDWTIHVITIFFLGGLISISISFLI